MMDETKKSLEKLGINELHDDYVSKKRFEDGGQYRFEVPGIQGPSALESLLEASNDYDLTIHRATQTKGIMFLLDDEISKMVDLAQDANMQLFLAVGPRAPYDTSATVQTEEGKRIGYRLRGYNNLVYAILLYDEGLLYALSKMRDAGELPKDLLFKLSAHAGCSNPASAKLFESIGLNSLNPVRDLQIPMLASLRDAIDIPIDIHTENPKSTGGFIRHYEVPEMIKVASPVYLKTGGSVAKHHSWDTTEKEARQRAKQVALIRDLIERHYPDAIMSKL